MHRRAISWARRRTRGADVAVRRFVAAGMAALVVVALGSVLVMRHVGRDQAIEDAVTTTRLAGDGIFAPAVTPALLRGDAAAIAHLDGLVDRIRGRIVVVKLWAPDGRVVYASEHRLIGRRFRLDDEELEAIRERTHDAEVSDLSAPENVYERHYGRLLEVYLGVRTPDGRAMLFESYQRVSAVAAGARALWGAFLPVLLGALGILALVQLPLARSLVHRVRRTEADRRMLLERSIDAQLQERRRIARDLHDGAVQTLAGTSYRLGALRGRLAPGASAADLAALDDSSEDVRASIRELRSLLVDIYPPSLEREGLKAALADLLTRTRGAGLATELVVDEPVDLPQEHANLLFRAAQEALRNVVAHAHASTVSVRVGSGEEATRLVVRDDGRGYDPAAVAPAAEDGRLGMRALEDLVRDQGGSLHVRSAPGAGTTVAIEVPVL